MVAVSSVTSFQTASPNQEVIECTATDEYTYTSGKFAYVDAVFPVLAEDTGALDIPISYTKSGNTITFRCTGLSANVINVGIWGH